MSTDGLPDAPGTVPETRAQGLWSELAAAAGLPPDVRGAELGRALDAGSVDVLEQVLPALLEVMRMAGPAAAEYHDQLAQLILALDAQVLAGALQKLDVPDLRRGLRTASRLLPPTSLVPLLVGGAPAYDHTVSAPFAQLLAKMAAAASPEGGADPGADEAFRTVVRHVNDRWATSLLTTAARGYDLLLEQGELPEASQSALAPGATRILQLALETGAVGPMVWLALSELVETEEGIRGVIEWLKRAEPSLASQAVTEQVATPTRLTLLLREQPIDWEAADALIRQLGTKAVRPLIELLAVADQRVLRRAIMDRIVQLGPDIQPMVVAWTRDERWYVVRNMVVLLRESGSYVEPVLGDTLATHPDPRVRREALLLRMERSGARERALSDGLRDPDKQVLRTALHAAGSSLPDSGALVLARRIHEPGFPAELRVLALHLLGRSGNPAALEALLRVVDGGKSLFGAGRLAPKSLELLAALGGLARTWSRDPRAREYLRLAAQSGDSEILAAIRPAASGSEQ